MNIESLRNRLASRFPGHLGIEIEEVAPERVLGALVVRPELCNNSGILHGGAIMSFADTLGGIGTMANLPSGFRTTTIESKTNFVRGASAGSRITGVATPIHRGRTTMVWQTHVLLEDGRLCAVVVQTQLVIPTEAGTGLPADPSG
jgi:1,4-dihydroxy-2-naphthoyl-CoA hydrolase